MKKKPGWGLWLIAACILVIFGSYVFYRQAYRPWKIRQDLEAIVEQIAAENYRFAHETLLHLLNYDMGPESTRQAKELLSQTVLAIAQEIEAKKSLSEAKEYLAAHLKDYGVGEEAEVLWDQMDLYRLQLGHRLESSHEYQAALNQYATVREDGLYFDEAQKSIRRIWLGLQKDHHQHQNLDLLLKEAEIHFGAKRYLTPVNQNAYAIYQTILGIDPDNTIALQRIEQMKTFYRGYGDSYFKKQKWRRALTYFERFILLDPDSRDIKEKINICRDKLTQVQAHAAKSPPAKKISEEKRNQVKRLLEESGTESSWIMKYLFEEQNGEKNTETPW